MKKSRYQFLSNYRLLTTILIRPKKLTITLLLLGLSAFQTIVQAQESISTKTPKSATTQENSWSFLHPYSAKYTVLSDGNKLGNAIRTLRYQNDQWNLETDAKASKFFFTMKSKESTEFKILDNELQTKRFHTRTKITFKKAREMEQIFNWDKKQESGYKGKRKWQIDLTRQAFDRVSHTVQLRSDLLMGKSNFSYNVSYKGKMNNYVYHLQKTEKIKTKIGELTVLKLVRNKSAKDTFILWLCPELNYFPVKIAQYEKDKPDITMLLESLDYLKE